MSDDFTVNIQGLDALQKALEQELPQKAKRFVRQGLRAGAVPVKNTMVEQAPKESGFMSENIDIKTRMERDELAGSAFIGPNGRAVYPRKIGPLRKGENASTRWTRTAAFVARMLEFGTSRMAKKPFMTQAFEVSKNRALDAIIAKLREVLEVE